MSLPIHKLNFKRQKRIGVFTLRQFRFEVEGRSIQFLYIGLKDRAKLVSDRFVVVSVFRKDTRVKVNVCENAKRDRRRKKRQERRNGDDTEHRIVKTVFFVFYRTHRFQPVFDHRICRIY